MIEDEDSDDDGNPIAGEMHFIVVVAYGENEYYIREADLEAHKDEEESDEEEDGEKKGTGSSEQAAAVEAETAKPDENTAGDAKVDGSLNDIALAMKGGQKGTETATVAASASAEDLLSTITDQQMRDCCEKHSEDVTSKGSLKDKDIYGIMNDILKFERTNAEMLLTGVLKDAEQAGVSSLPPIFQKFDPNNIETINKYLLAMFERVKTTERIAAIAAAEGIMGNITDDQLRAYCKKQSSDVEAMRNLTASDVHGNMSDTLGLDAASADTLLTGFLAEGTQAGMSFSKSGDYHKRNIENLNKIARAMNKRQKEATAAAAVAAAEGIMTDIRDEQLKECCNKQNEDVDYQDHLTAEDVTDIIMDKMKLDSTDADILLTGILADAELAGTSFPEDAQYAKSDIRNINKFARAMKKRLKEAAAAAEALAIAGAESILENITEEQLNLYCETQSAEVDSKTILNKTNNVYGIMKETLKVDSTGAETLMAGILNEGESTPGVSLPADGDYDKNSIDGINTIVMAMKKRQQRGINKLVLPPAPPAGAYDGKLKDKFLNRHKNKLKAKCTNTGKLKA